ncbi:MAG: hypothetical protein KDB68_14385 [Planctomycetes bacterium]|nr:hypothetical protein [Planctomycetota bacterium]MCA8937383.1 hypothetical protein [Planctomycetota bacterium]MCA8945322.1 hypothetical protein [Planctomycetota bacterium]
MSDDGDMPAKEFKELQKAFKKKKVVGPCPACGADFDSRAIVSNYVSLHFTASRDEDTDESGASFAAGICTNCGHTWLFHADTLTG